MWQNLEILSVVFVMLLTIPCCLLATRATLRSHWWLWVPYALVLIHVSALYAQGKSSPFATFVVLSIATILWMLMVSVCRSMNRLGMPLEPADPDKPIALPLPE